MGSAPVDCPAQYLVAGAKAYDDTRFSPGARSLNNTLRAIHEGEYQFNWKLNDSTLRREGRRHQCFVSCPVIRAPLLIRILPLRKLLELATVPPDKMRRPIYGQRQTHLICLPIQFAF
jgi:hypothetical protein